ncbi:unnamed protein product [Rhizoctonia solani]|uniref:CHAT domain-containing protein n=1 Tax=Rhizoctonia solani TaxID=456999 RepID=A0A8H3CVF5_9AGAM|nr:unnamed protein product [Rhizoctonia solani]
MNQDGKESIVAEDSMSWEETLLKLTDLLLHRATTTTNIRDAESLLGNILIQAEEQAMCKPENKEDICRALADISTKINQSFESLENVEVFALSLRCLHFAIDHAPSHTADLPYWLNNASIMCEARFQALGGRSNFDEAISLLARAVTHSPETNPSTTTWIGNLGSLYNERYDKWGELDDLEKAIQFKLKAVELAPNDDPYLPAWLNNLGVAYTTRYQILEHPVDIESAIEYITRAITITPGDHPNMLDWLASLGRAHETRFRQMKNPDDINRAIEYKTRVVLGTPDGSHDLPTRLNGLGECLNTRFIWFEDLADIDNAVEHLSRAVVISSDGDQRLPYYLNNLGDALDSRFNRLGNQEDIENSIIYFARAVELTPEGGYALVNRLKNLGSAHGTRFDRSGNLDDINQAIQLLVRAVSLLPRPEEHPNFRNILSRLAASYTRRFMRLGDEDDINKAIYHMNYAIAFTSESHLELPDLLGRLGSIMETRFSRSNNLDDIDQSIKHLNRAVELSSKGDPDLPSRLSDLGTSYDTRFGSLGSLEDIDKAISLHIRAIDLTPEDHPDLLMWFNNLGNAYQRRYKRLGYMDDLNKAIDLLSKSVKLTPDDHPELPGVLGNLGVAHETRLHAVGAFDDIDKSVQYLTRALELVPEDHSDIPPLLNNLGISHKTRFLECGDQNDINIAIHYLIRAVSLTPEGHPDLPNWLNTLGNSYESRFEKFGDPGDIENAIRNSTRAIELTPKGHPHRPNRLRNLGISYNILFDSSYTEDSLRKSIECFTKSSQCLVGDPLIKIQAARQWGQLASQSQEADSIQAYQTALNLVPQLAWLGAQVDRRYEEIKSISDLAVEAACAAIDACKYSLALEWLEQARSIVWNQVLQLQTPVDNLRAFHSALADRIQNIADQLFIANVEPETSTTDDLVSEEMSQKPRRLAEEYEQLLHDIRQLDGFQDFLRPKTASELIPTGKNGPVVVLNCYKQRCDALIITPGMQDVTHVPLPSFDADKAKSARIPIERALRGSSINERSQLRRPLVHNEENDFENVLATLWLDVAKPLLDHLGYTNNVQTDELPRITWCLTGALSFLPIHAAGLYYQPHSKLSDFAISSYTPTVTTLLSSLRSSNCHHSSLLAIGQEETPGLSRLPGTTHELAHIALHSQNHSKYTQLMGREAKVTTVINAMEEHDWVHFACHAHQNAADPSASGFFLSNGTLELSTIRNKAFKGKGLAFLSACQTATGAKQLPDEVLHLASGMLMAGYPTVIGTMWSVMDSDAPFIADRVYGWLLKDGSMNSREAAKALHYAVAALRENVGEKAFTRWVPYIHFGI